MYGRIARSGRLITGNHLSLTIAGIIWLAASPANGQDVDALQQQIEELQRQIDSLHRQVEQQRQRTEESARIVEQASQAVDPSTDGEAEVTSGQERVSLEISGQVNRMLNVADDGHRTKLYNVDNGNSGTRFRFVGDTELTEDLTAGFNIELQVLSNPSGEVSQQNEDTGSANVTDRIIEAVFASEKYGRIRLGQGSVASDGTSEIDLSGTSVIGYSSVADTAGGLLFYDDDADGYSDVTVGDSFNNFDGLGRQDRIRYDSPFFAGFSVSGSGISNERWDAALRWAADIGETTAAAAVAYADPGGDEDYVVSSSASVLFQPGISLTGSFATRDRDGRDDSYNYYGKVGYKADFVDFGSTAFGLDYTFGKDIRVDGADSQSVGLQAVQAVADYGLDLYSGLRWYTTDAGGGEDFDFDDIVVFSAGTRVKF